jgi:hypothetical protein
VAISAGLDFSLALRADGTLVGWGANNAGQLSIPSSATSLLAISAGTYHALALKADGTVLAWGDNTNFQANVPANMASFTTTPDSYATDRRSINTTNITFYSITNVYGVYTSAQHTEVVADTLPPVITLNGANPLAMSVATAFVDPGVTATDQCAGDVTGSLVVFGTVNTNRPGTYSLTYAATDPTGNVATTNRVVWVTPSQPQPASTITLSAAANPGGCDTTVYFQYGLTTSYGSSTTPQDIGSGNSLVPISLTLSNLQAGATYHYRMVSSGCSGTTYGPDMTFTTSPYVVPGDLNGDGIIDQSELNLLLSSYWPSSPWLSMTDTFGLSTTNILFSLTNANNFDLSVLVSTNLVDWDYLGVAHQRYQFFDPAATNAPQRYYRLRWP